MATDGTPRQPADDPQGEPSAPNPFNLSGKMLMIAVGGGAGLLAVIAVVVLFLTGAFGGGGSGGGSLLGYIPGDAGFVTIKDTRALMNREGLEDYAEFLQDGGDDPRDTKDIGMDDDNIELFAVVYESLGGDDRLWIAQGDFEFDAIREELDDGLRCEEDDYRGFEMWECSGRGFPAAVAIFEKDGYVVIVSQRPSDLERLLTYMSREPENLADAEDSDIRRILNAVGDGWLRFAAVGDCPVERCQGSGFALRGDDSDAIDVSFALMFGSERSAESMEDDINIDDYVRYLFSILALDLEIGNVQADGEFVVGDGNAEFADPDEPRSSNRDGGSGSAPSAAAAVPAGYIAPVGSTATPVPEQASQSLVGRGEWVEDCSAITLAETNQYLARHEQISRDDAYVHCECLHDYIQEWEGPPAAKMSDVAAGRLGADPLGFVNVLSDASSYCTGL